MSELASESPARGNSRIGVTGLAVMGANLARNIARHGVPVAVHNRTTARTKEFMEAYAAEGTFTATESTADFVAALERPRRIIVMVKAGPPVDGVIEELTPLLDEGDIIIDAGNSHFPDTKRRTEECAADGIRFMGVGVSGGEEGALNGPSIMPGGDPAAYAEVEEVLTAIAANVDGTPCCVHVGPDGAGHYVKMVHNGIEYADIQLIAEAYDLLTHVGGLDAHVHRQDLRGVELRRPRVVPDRDHGDRAAEDRRAPASRSSTRSSTRPSRRAPAAGPARTRSTSGCRSRGSPRRCSPARSRRCATSGRRRHRRWQGPRPGEGGVPDNLVDDIRQALYASKIVAYAQGFAQMRAASQVNDWGLDLGAMATIWRGGCIIRAQFLNRISEAYAEHGDIENLMMVPYFTQGLAERAGRVAARGGGGHRAGCGDPGVLQLAVLLRRLPPRTRTGQPHPGLRDYFGAHTYRRIDAEGSFHTRWGQDGTEVRTDA